MLRRQRALRGTILRRARSAARPGPVLALSAGGADSPECVPGRVSHAVERVAFSSKQAQLS